MENKRQKISNFKTIKSKQSMIFQLWQRVKVRVEKVITITLMLVVSLQQQSYATSLLNVQSAQMITVYSFSYDQNGNLVAEAQDGTLLKGYQYNDLNQLEYFSDEKKSKTYLYHYYSNGQRSQKEDLSTGNIIHFYYGQKGKLLNEALSLTGEEKRSSYFAGNRFIRNISNQNDSTLQTPLAIRKNNPLSVDLSAGISTKESVHLDDYGLQSDENSQVNQSLPSGDKHPRMGAYEEDDFNFDRNPFIYGTGYYDSESGLNFQRARYYNPATQSFMAQDSKDLVNRYNYADSNPVMNYDPSGHNAISDAFHKGISVLGGKGAVYGLNSAAMLTSLLSAGSLLLLPPSPLSFMMMSAEIVSFTAGGSAVFAQAAVDYKFFDHQTSQRLHDAADIIGLIDLPFSVAAGATGIANEAAKRMGQVDKVGLLSTASKSLNMYREDVFKGTQLWFKAGYERFKYKAASLFGPSFEIYKIEQTEKGFSMFIETKRLSVANKLADDGERIFSNSKIQRALAKQHPETSIENIQHVDSNWTKFDVRGSSTEKLKGIKYGEVYTVEIEYKLNV